MQGARRHRLRIPALALFGLLLTARCSPLDERQFYCELAASHLKDCCGDAFDARGLYCEQVDYGCGQQPDLTLAEGRCLVELSCEIIIRNGLCEVEALRPHAHRPPVCS